MNITVQEISTELRSRGYSAMSVPVSPVIIPPYSPPTLIPSLPPPISVPPYSVPVSPPASPPVAVAGAQIPWAVILVVGTFALFSGGDKRTRKGSRP